MSSDARIPEAVVLERPATIQQAPPTAASRAGGHHPNIPPRGHPEGPRVSGPRASSPRSIRRYALPVGAPLAVLLAAGLLWQFGIHQAQLPPPSAIGSALRDNRDTILTGARVTFWEEALRGYLIGCGLGLLGGALCARVAWLRRGLLPYAVVSNSIPIIGLAPIMIFWFGLEWPSKAAVVAVLTFFPMLINTVTGLTSYSPLARDLLTSYGASGWVVFTKLQLPGALPMIFNGLKICSTLSIIGAVIAEYFPGQINGLGFQIQNEASSGSWDVVWAYVAVTCGVGIAFYAALLVVERLLTFWHISYRR